VVERVDATFSSLFVTNTYKFKCANGPCSEVTLTRVDRGGAYKSTLTKGASAYELRLRQLRRLQGQGDAEVGTRL
jgi:hypothetical protein